MKKLSKIEISLYDCIFIIISIISLISIFLLGIDKFSSLLTLISSLILLFLIFKLLIKFKKFIIDKYLIFLIFIALVIRLNPFYYLPVGADYGAYVSLSQQLETKQSMNIKDEFRAKMPNEIKQIYDKNKNGVTPGVFWVDKSASILQFRFYPLHAIWMTLFSFLFSSQNRLYSLTLFSLLSIISFYKLTNMFLNNKKKAFYISLLIVFHPLHLFLSKLPYAEVMVMFFSLNFTLYFVKFYQNIKSKKTILYAILSILSLILMFFCKLNFVLYLPVIWLTINILIILNTNQLKKKFLLLYLFFIFITTFIVIIYYYLKIPTVYLLTINHYVYPIIDSKFSLILILFILFLFPLCIYKNQYLRDFLYNKIFKIIIKKWRILSFIFIIILLIIFAYNLYYLGFSGKLQISQFNRENLGLFSIRFLSVYSLIMYLSPLVVFFIIFAFFKSKIINQKNLLIFIIFVVTICALSLQVKYTNYHFNYARYLLPEIVTYGFIVLSLLLKQCSFNKQKIILTITIAYFCFFSIFQIKATEQADLKPFNTIDHKVKKSDLLIINNAYQNWPLIEMQTPLRYFYNLKIFNISSQKELKLLVKHNFINKFSQVYFLSASKISFLNSNITEYKLNYNQKFITNTDRHFFHNFEIDCDDCVMSDLFKYWIPIYNQDIKTTIYLYQLTPNDK